MSFETPAIFASIAMMSTSILASVLSRRSRTQTADRTITITIGDSTGARARMVTHSSRRVDDVKRMLERIVAQPS